MCRLYDIQQIYWFIVQKRKEKPKTTKRSWSEVFTPDALFPLPLRRRVPDRCRPDQRTMIQQLQKRNLSTTPGGDRCCRYQPCVTVQVISRARWAEGLKQRDDHAKIQDRETVKRSLQSGEPNDAVDEELFRKKARLVGPFKKVRTREEVDFQWSRPAVSTGSPMNFFDNEEVRKAVLMTSECVENYLI